MITIKTLSGISLPVISDAFNGAFADYFIHIEITPEKLAGKMQQESIDLDWSVGVFDGSELVGFILNGFRDSDGKKSLYNGGTGVLPAYRGRQYTQQMYDFLLPKLASAGINEMKLEVLVQNHSALKIYEAAGFKISRELICFSGSPQSTIQADGIDIRPLSEMPGSISGWCEWEPSWPATTASLQLVQKQMLMAGAYGGGELVGYIVVSNAGRLFQLVVAPGMRRKKIGSALVHYCFEKENLTAMLALNIDTADASSVNFFTHLGWKEAVRQYEMIRMC